MGEMAHAERCKTNVPRNGDICNLPEDEICYTVIVILARLFAQKAKYLINMPKQMTS